jgi:hypothetical protein
VKARQVLFWFGVRELGYSGAEVARYLGVSTSCVNDLFHEGKTRMRISTFIRSELSAPTSPLRG